MLKFNTLKSLIKTSLLYLKQNKNQNKILKMLIKAKNLNEYTRTPKKRLVKEIIKIKKKIISLTLTKSDTYQSVCFCENNKRQKTITNNYKTLSHFSISKIMSINAEIRNFAWLLKNKGLKPYRYLLIDILIIMSDKCAL